jgi:glycosyltransferase involved in cell wall biosynthesis
LLLIGGVGGAWGPDSHEICQCVSPVVIPAYNDAGNIGRLIEETVAAVPEASLQEVIVVDDASDDGTGAEIKAMLGRYKPLRYLRHGRRAGQSAALRSGVIAATAPIIATMDGDGQNDPADIMRLVSRLGRNGREPALVGGLREGRKAKGSRKAASRFANWIRDKVPALFLTYGHEIAYEPVNDRLRLEGASKYTNLGRALIGLYDLVGVSWLRKRTLLPPIAEDLSGANAANEKAHASQVKVGAS